MVFISMQPIIQDINNAILTGTMAMPMKDLTSDGSSRFSMGRKDFIRGYIPSQPSFTAANNPLKKWIGGNRDASQFTNSRRMNSIGNGSVNASGKAIAFTAPHEINVVRDALIRTRAGGAVVPKKCTDKYPGASIW
jgi:hypothetical protein